MKSQNQGSRPHFYTQNEVSTHNTASDLWVSFLGHVYDLTKLAEEHSGSSSLLLLITIESFICR